MIFLKAVFHIATSLDVEDIIKLTNECFFENTDVCKAKEIFLSTSKDPNNIYLVGCVEKEVVAHAKITIIETIYEPMGCYAILNHVCVKPEYRRHNIATQMLDEITKICKEREVLKMELWSNNVRVPAHSCYKKYGFVLEEAGFFSKEIG